MSEFRVRLKRVKLKDILSIFPMILSFFLSIPIRLFRRNLWLICERKDEARDNGYWFFKYLRLNHPEIDTVYAISRNSVDYDKVASLGKVVKFGSFNHWILYFVARWNISSQKEGKPNAAVCYFLEVYLGLRKNRIYLKHGIIKDYQRWIFNDVSKLSYLCCASKQERDYILKEFGYKEEQLKLVGLCRFDNLLTQHTIKKQILVMPTMREWLKQEGSEMKTIEGVKTFNESNYFKTWNAFLHSLDILKLLHLYNLKLIFYLHPVMQKYVQYFGYIDENIIIASYKDFDMQQLLMESSCLITDYSSIFFDFAYMRKPLLYYQFDEEIYRKMHYQQGYFDYDINGFGPVKRQLAELINELDRICNNEFAIDKKYKDRINSFFEFNDSNNCLRTFLMINELKKRNRK